MWHLHRHKSLLFETKDSAVCNVLKFLSTAFRLEETKETKLLAHSIVSDLKTNEVLVYNSDCNAIAICIDNHTNFKTSDGTKNNLDNSPQSVYGFIHFNEQSEQNIEEEEEMDWVNCLISLLPKMPHGFSCTELALWDTIAPNSANFIDFIIENNEIIRSKIPNKVFYHMSGTNDCILLPFIESNALPDSEMNTFYDPLKQALLCKNYREAASWVLAGTLSFVDHDIIRSMLKDYFLTIFENSGTQAMDELLTNYLGISFALPPQCDLRNVLKVCLTAICETTKNSYDGMQRATTRFLKFGQQQDSMNRLEMIRRLSIVGATSKREFGVFYEFSKEWLNGKIPFVANTSSNSTEHQELLNGGSRGNDLMSIEKDNSELLDYCVVNIAESQMIENKSDDAKDFVLELLKNDFHYSVTDTGTLVRPPVESSEGIKLQKALDLLSGSLYSSNVHFVMELIQNTDDNIYHQNTSPTVKLELYPHAIVVHNNEIGFSRENIVAVCNVGGSTKSGQSGYIGQKGIG